MNFNEWVTRTTRNDSMRQIAERADISDRTLSRQLRENDLRPEMIIKIAEAYNESPVIALVDLGFMSARWITEPGVVTALSRASDEELTDELLRRLQMLPNAPVDELAEQRRSKRTSPNLPADSYDDGTVRDFDWGIPHAADSSPNETEERLNRGEDPID